MDRVSFMFDVRSTPGTREVHRRGVEGRSRGWWGENERDGPGVTGGRVDVPVQDGTVKRDRHGRRTLQEGVCTRK